MESLCRQLFKLVSYEIFYQRGVFLVCKLTDDGKLKPETTITLEFLEEIFFDNNISNIEEILTKSKNILLANF